MNGWIHSAAGLEMPVPLVDLDRLERNLDRMAAYAGSHGLARRPHAKTHKSPHDAGSKALGREPPDREGDGFGALLDRPEVVVQRLSEEHGILDLRDSGWQPAVGEQVRVVPNHVCIVVHLHEMIYGVRGTQVETSWPVKARGRQPLGKSRECC